MNTPNHVVRSVIAYHTHREAADVRTSDRLYGNLRLTVLGLALVILDIEDILDVRVTTPRLDLIETVEDLTRMTGEAINTEQPEESHVHVRLARRLA